MPNQTNSNTFQCKTALTTQNHTKNKNQVERLQSALQDNSSKKPAINVESIAQANGVNRLKLSKYVNKHHST